MRTLQYQSRALPLQPPEVTVDQWYMQHPDPPKARAAPGIACLTAGAVLALLPIDVPADGWSRATNPNPSPCPAPGVACLTAGGVLPLQPVEVPADGWSRATNPNPVAPQRPGIAVLTAGVVIPFHEIVPVPPPVPDFIGAVRTDFLFPRRTTAHPAYLPPLSQPEIVMVAVPDLTIGIRADASSWFITTEADLSAWTTSYTIIEYTKD